MYSYKIELREYTYMNLSKVDNKRIGIYDLIAFLIFFYIKDSKTFFSFPIFYLYKYKHNVNLIRPSHASKEGGYTRRMFPTIFQDRCAMLTVYFVRVCIINMDKYIDNIHIRASVMILLDN